MYSTQTKNRGINMRRLSGFSLMEMMTVLLIVSVVAAASAPMINKRMMVNQAAGGCVWERLANDSIYYQGADNSSVIIGADRTNNNLDPKLHIRTTDGDPFITFERDGVNNQLALRYRANTLGLSANEPADGATALGVSADASGANSIALGGASTNSTGAIAIGPGISNATAESPYATAIGYDTSAEGHSSIVIGVHSLAGDNNSIAIGRTAIADNENSIAIGTEANTGFNKSVAIGFHTIANGTATVAIGTTANALGTNSTAIGAGAKAEAEGCIAIGTTARASREENEVNGVPAFYSIAIGEEAEARMPNSIAIGHGAIATKENQIVLGAAANKTRNQNDYTVYIPGNLVVGGDVLLNAEKGSTFLRVFDSGESQRFNNQKTYLSVLHSGDFIGADDNFWKFYENRTNGCIPTSQRAFVEAYTKSDNVTTTSDRRLKNVGKAFTSGLAEIKKIEVFNYTFKKDESKTPRVGVMAQDLQKIFPNAVTKGEDGFLRIRMEDMFYAVVNAVKELASMFDKQDERIVQLEKENCELHKTVNELEKQNKEILKRLEKLEKQK